MYSASSPSQGDLEKAAEWLELFVDISESSEQHDCLMNACNSIGTFHNTLVCLGGVVKVGGKPLHLC